MQAANEWANVLERDHELGALDRAVAGARAGRGSAVLVAGEAGAGKTTLVRAFLAQLGTRAVTLTAGCDPLSTPAPRGLLRDLGTSSSRLRAALRADSAPFDLFEVVHGIVSEQPTVLVLEDLHWADEASLDVVRLLVRRVGSLPAVIVVTYRPDDRDGDHALRPLLGDIATAPDVVRLAPSPLSVGAIARLANGRRIDAALVHATTRGNPFFVTELLDADEDGVPRTVRDAVLARFRGCDPATRTLIETVALSAGPVECELVRRLGLLGGGVVGAAIATGLVEQSDERFQFRHEIARRAAADDVLPDRRIALHRQILDALNGTPRIAVDAARLAHHAEAAHDAEATYDYAMRAAREAADAGSFREAAAQFQRALASATDRPPDERAAVLMGRSRACYLADDQVEAIAVVRTAVELQRSVGATDDEAIALAELAGYLRCRGHLGDAVAAVRRASTLLGDESSPASRAAVLEGQAIDVLIAGDAGRALELATEAHRLAVAAGHDLLAGHAMVSIASSRAELDDDGWRDELEAVVQFAEHTRTHEVGARALNALGGRLARRGHRTEGADELERAIDYCRDRSQDLWRINVQAIAARTALERGVWNTAVDHATAVLDDPRDSPWPHHEAWLVIATVRCRRGDPGAADALERARAVGVPTDEVDAHADLAAVIAELAWSEGRLGDLPRTARCPGTARVAFWSALAGDDTEVVVAAATAASSGSSTDDPYELAVARRWSEAVAAFVRVELPYEAALAGVMCDGDVAKAAHEQLVAMAARPAARWAARRLRAAGVDGIERLPHPSTCRHPAGLTGRQAEVFSLMADGLRNADIAERLVISRRTVDHHVAAILRKVDARTRSEAIARIGELSAVVEI